MESLFQSAPKNAWNAVITQLLCWSFRKFCAAKLQSEADLSWDSYFSLVSEYAPMQFKPHLNHWLAPEQLANVPNLSAIDEIFRILMKDLDTGSEEVQEKLATLLDDDISPMIERWLGPVYAPYSLFPSPSESTTDIDLTKLHAILYLLSPKERARRKSIRPLVLSEKKTRRNKQNEALQLYVRAAPRGADTEGKDAKNTYSEGEKREGVQENRTEGERTEHDQHNASE